MPPECRKGRGDVNVKHDGKRVKVWLFERRGAAYLVCLSKKSGKISEFVEQFRGRELDAHYLGYFECFNRQLFYEAHEVLEELWLPDRGALNGDFYKGLIQLAGAFVHLQKNRLKPSAALFRLAEANLRKYPAEHEKLEVGVVLGLIQSWMRELESGEFKKNPWSHCEAPRLKLLR
jgi:predicted metal-dependent hydrolase